MIDERVLKLLQSFTEAAMREYDVSLIVDLPAQHKAVHDIMAIVKELDSVAPKGRAVLACLFNHPHLGVREKAATCLSETMPEQALPVLQIVDAFDVGPARLAASRTISRIERAMKSREAGPASQGGDESNNI
jgi:hypothetical protein